MMPSMKIAAQIIRAMGFTKFNANFIKGCTFFSSNAFRPNRASRLAASADVSPLSRGVFSRLERGTPMYRSFRSLSSPDGISSGLHMVSFRRFASEAMEGAHGD